MTYTFFYVVGGEDIYYDQLKKSIRSLSRLSIDYRVTVLDFSGKMSSFDNVTVIHIPLKFDFSSQRHKFYQYKYYICQLLETDRGIYLDCDTVICYDEIENIFNRIGDSFGVVPHFCIKTLYDSLTYFGDNYSNKIKEMNFFDKHGSSGLETFISGGAFFFSNNANCHSILSTTFQLHNCIYKSDDKFINGFFDETFLSIALKRHKHKFISGAANHCCANHMPLELIDGKLKGGNPRELPLQNILIFHGFSDRQIQGLDYTGELQEEIQKMWNI